jgi:hypothetical protein
MSSATGTQLATLIQAAVEALAARGFDPRRAPLDLPEEKVQEVAEKIAQVAESAGEVGVKAVNLLTAAAVAGAEKLSSMDPATFENSKFARVLEELLRRSDERTGGRRL